MSLVAQSVCKIDSGRIKPSVAGSIPALSAIFTYHRLTILAFLPSSYQECCTDGTNCIGVGICGKYINNQKGNFGRLYEKSNS